ncbi:FAD-binding oxidoreductase [Pontivivens insulae]|uniref:Putative FAD-linked oxidoreductase n=1 Tax=Pontivivens insulae TaxID=1639689 RepID=A0A2R8A770_9RHOB|nr:FAD-binding oxidoreductase [Pontivivens insulae]RED18186.1 FAD/FMN-containing dehydrogenase [Pontivivens insulae]SPF28084.1 putative FAD-linked oxidoreductase [Pontivivens insulae]
MTDFLNDLPDLTLSVPTQAYLEEPRGRYQGRGLTVAKPATVDAVAAVLTRCNARGVGVIPWGGGTGLVGGQVSETRDCVILSLEKLNRVRDCAPGDATLTVEAGVTLAEAQAEAAKVNRLFPLSIASEGSARIGGVLATNAGGVNVLRYGNARDLVLGIEAVLADGTIVSDLKRLRKDNTGYDLRHLLIGAEGTLGVITAASLRLMPIPAERSTAFLAVESPKAALNLLADMQGRLGESISAFELIHRQGLDFLAEHFPAMRHPLESRPDWMVLVEIGGSKGSAAAFETALEAAFEAELVSDAVLAQSDGQRQALWDIRETIPEGNRLTGSISSHDISVPLSRLPEFIERAGVAVRAIAPDARINCFGHVGDGNLHYNVFPAPGRMKADYVNMRGQVQTAVHEVADALDGSVSAEHGIGRLKVGDLERFGDPGKRIAMRAIKAALDPNGIMNPGALFDGAPLG